MHELLVRVAYTHLPFFTFITGAVTSLTLENFDGVTEIKVHLPFSTPILIALQVQVNLDVVHGKVAFDIARNKTDFN